LTGPPANDGCSDISSSKTNKADPFGSALFFGSVVDAGVPGRVSVIGRFGTMAEASPASPLQLPTAAIR